MKSDEEFGYTSTGFCIAIVQYMLHHVCLSAERESNKQGWEVSLYQFKLAWQKQVSARVFTKAHEVPEYNRHLR